MLCLAGTTYLYILPVIASTWLVQHMISQPGPYPGGTPTHPHPPTHLFTQAPPKQYHAPTKCKAKASESAARLLNTEMWVVFRGSTGTSSNQRRSSLFRPRETRARFPDYARKVGFCSPEKDTDALNFCFWRELQPRGSLPHMRLNNM